MLKKAALAVFGLALALSFSAPKAQAEVHVGIAVAAPGVYGAVAVQPVNCNNHAYGYSSYDNPYAYDSSYAYNTAPYATYGYYDSGHYYYGPINRDHDRDWRHDRAVKNEKWEHERGREDHDHDRR